ncbi:hypothetical protein BJ742DRAFT_417770 [Cladochytrium replicatum]|nr:hypothetical protein BJ742DRAFT_417770 [Cladochytrium replicatum]
MMAAANSIVPDDLQNHLLLMLSNIATTATSNSDNPKKRSFADFVNSSNLNHYPLPSALPQTSFDLSLLAHAHAAKRSHIADPYDLDDNDLLDGDFSAPQFKMEQGNHLSESTTIDLTTDDRLLPSGKKKPGRKPATTEPTSKRTAQNRAAQRAFRDRKERYVKDLEARVKELEAANTAALSGPPDDPGQAPSTVSLIVENLALRSKVKQLQSENFSLRNTTAAPVIPAVAPIRGSSTSSSATDVFLRSSSTSSTPNPPTFASPATSSPSLLDHTSSATSSNAVFPPPLAPPSPTNNFNFAFPTSDTLDFSSLLSAPSYFDVANPPAVPFDFSSLFSTPAAAQPRLTPPTSAPNDDDDWLLSDFTGFSPADILSIATANTATNRYVPTSHPATTASQPALDTGSSAPCSKLCENAEIVDKVKQFVDDEAALDELCDMFSSKATCSEIQQVQSLMVEACKNDDKEGFLELVNNCREKKRMYMVSISKSDIEWRQRGVGMERKRISNGRAIGWIVAPLDGNGKGPMA